MAHVVESFNRSKGTNRYTSGEVIYFLWGGILALAPRTEARGAVDENVRTPFLRHVLSNIYILIVIQSILNIETVLCLKPLETIE